MAYLNYDISSEEYNLAYRTAYKIINELEYKKNIFYNRGLIDYYDYKNNKKLVKKHWHFKVYNVILVLLIY